MSTNLIMMDIKMMEVIVQPLQQGLNNAQFRFDTFTANMPVNSKLIDLKRAIHRKWALHPKQQRLTYISLLTDDQKRLEEYHIDSINPILVEVISETIKLCIVKHDGGREQVNQNLNKKLSVLKDVENSTALVNYRLQLCFNDRILEWGDQIRTVQGLEDGSELHILPLGTLSVAFEDKEATFPDVDLNLTAGEFKNMYLNGRGRSDFDQYVAGKLMMASSWEFILNDYVLPSTNPLKTIKGLKDGSILQLRITVLGGNFVA